AGWPVPARVRVAVLLAAETARLDHRALLLGRAGGEPVAIVDADAEDPSPLAGTPHAAGPAVAAADAPASLAGARRLATLAHSGAIPADRAHRWEDHLATLIVHADRE